MREDLDEVEHAHLMLVEISESGSSVKLSEEEEKLSFGIFKNSF